MMEESIFKSCLKRKVKFTASTFVKFLITGTVALSLTACGGGGGGGGSSSGGNGGGVIEKLPAENTKLSKETLVTKNEIFTNKGNVDLTENKTEDSVVGIVGKNSDILNEAEIKIDDITVNNSKILLASETGENLLKKFQEKGKSFAIFAEGGSVTNEADGKLNITGDSVTGIVGLYSDIVNKGKIFTTDKIEDTREAVGIMAIGSNVTNDGDINLVSYEGTGILAYNNGADLDGIKVDSGKRISVVNNKNISIKGEESRGIVADGADIDVTNNGTLSLEGIDVDGIVVQGNNISVTNNKDIIITNNGTKENHGKIEYVSGINIKRGEGNTVVNKGNITVSLNTKDGVYVASGITSDEKVDVTNSGTITINSDIKADTDEDITFEEYIESFSYGIKTNGKITNEKDGTINISGTAVGISGKDITNNGTINITGIDVEIPNSEGEVQDYKIPTGIVIIGENTQATNNGNITINNFSAQAMAGFNGATIINKKYIEIKNGNEASALNGENSTVINDGDIKFLSGIYVNGMEISGGTAINNGTIEISSESSHGIFIEDGGVATNNNTINIKNKYSSGMYLYENGNVINETKGIINVSGTESCGIYSQMENAETTEEELKPELFPINKGTINITGENSYGMVAQTINRENEVLIGAAVLNGNKDFRDAVINVVSNNSTGMLGNKGGILNYGKINVSGENSVGMKTTGLAFADNYGTITVTGNNSIGMSAENSGQVTNEVGGIINVNGTGSYAMKADGENSWACNDGTINVGKNAGGAMQATNGGKITNDKNGVINIDSSLVDTQELADNFALKADNNSIIENLGKVNFDKEITITTDSTSAYIIGTNKDGSYGKVSAETVNVDGNVKASAEIAKDGYKDSYFLDNAVSGKTELGKNYKLSSTSLLYDAVSKTDEDGNLDVELVRNDTDISDLTSKGVSKAAGIFDRAMKNENLSHEQKEFVEKVFDSTSSAKKTDDVVKELTGYNVYSNIARQMFDTKDMFVSYDKSVIDSLGDYNFNFNFIGNYADVDSKNDAAGYDSKVTGINGAVRFTDSVYGVIGYGYNDIDYDGSSDGTVETIHTGIYKDIKSQYGDIRTGIFGEYNFHETDREISGEKADSDFNSYVIGANAEISQKFGDDLYIKPALSFNLSYGKYEDFKENGGLDIKYSEEDYVSAVPALELKFGKEFNSSEIYGAVKYSYELGDLNKEQEIEFFNEKENIQADNIEDAQTDIKFGASLSIKNISVNGEIGKEFGKRDREYIKAGVSYTF